MIYKLTLKEEVKKDLSKLSSHQKMLVLKQFKKLQTSYKKEYNVNYKSRY